MSLLDDLAARTDHRRQNECSVAYALRQLDDHTADKFRTVLAMPPNVVGHADIVRAFEEADQRVGADSVRRHRRPGHVCADS